MTITAKVIAHSRTPGAPELITLQCRYPRFIHAEFMTHRVFSRNASSSRAIPIERMIQDVIDDPAMPVAWGSNKPGMQAGGECTNPVKINVIADDGTGLLELPLSVRNETAWLSARDAAVHHARAFAAAGYHKQIANRLLEPFGHISVVVTATEWDNFFALRCHPDADPTMRALAEAMRDAIAGSVPYKPESGEWRELAHLPYFTDDDSGELATRGYDKDAQTFQKAAMMISAARCARVSYLNHDGSNPDIDKDLALADMLLKSRHMSPFEHQACVTGDEGTALWGNFVGWDQHRKMLELHQ